MQSMWLLLLGLVVVSGLLLASAGGSGRPERSKQGV